MKFIIKGNFPGISKEEIRAVFHACDIILQFHNKRPILNIIEVKISDEDLGIAWKSKSQSRAVGQANVQMCIIKILREEKTYSEFVTVVLHEMIHLYLRFPDGVEEKLASTLTAKLKPDVVRIANILVENTYKRAGYFAHLKISYLPDGKDFFDDNQYHKKHDDSTGKKYRNKLQIVYSGE